MRKLIGFSILAVFTVGCGQDAVSPIDGGPNAAISDAAHGGGNPRFYWLPPMVKNPSPTGVFNPTLAPTVQICEWNAVCVGAPIATYTTTSGPGGEVVVVDDVNELYKVNWHTDQFILDPALTYRITVLVGTLELGFADVDVVTSGKELKNVITGEFIGLKDGRTLPIKFRIEQGALVAATGGTPCTGECGEALVASVPGQPGTSAPTTVLTSAAAAGTFFPQGALPLGEEGGEQVVIVLERITLAPGERCLSNLPTQLVEQVGCFRFRTIPEFAQFNADASVGICIQDPFGFHDENENLIRLYRQGNNGEVTALPRVTLPFELNCGSQVGEASGGGLFGNLASSVSRRVKSLFGVRELTANSGVLVDRGMGGSSGAFSRITAADNEFVDGFESDSGWTTTGFWHRSTLVGDTNQAVGGGFVNLAPNDTSSGRLPAPANGSYAFWYGDSVGNPLAGNYIGEQRPTDVAGSGGLSVTGNTGTLTSPVIPMPPDEGQTVELRFNTWFEIESVDAPFFDIMRVSVVDVVPDTIAVLGVLNPTVDVNGAVTQPYTTAGHNLAPVWVPRTIDVSAFKGKTIRLVFEFDTIDGLYNGFRGWILDDVSIRQVPPLAAMMLQSAGASSSLNPDPPKVGRQ